MNELEEALAGERERLRWLPSGLLICGGCLMVVGAILMLTVGVAAGLGPFFVGLAGTMAGMVVLTRRTSRKTP